MSGKRPLPRRTRIATARSGPERVRATRELRAGALAGLFLIAGGIGSSLALAGTEPEAVSLQAGASHEREIAGSEVHRYPVDLAAGQYFEALVIQRGATVRVRITSPGRGALADLGSASDEDGSIPLAFVAGTPGEYLVEVRARDPKASRARYLLRVESLRSPTPGDLARVDAAEAHNEAARAFRDEKREEHANTLLRTYSGLLTRWQALGDRRLEADTLSLMMNIQAEALGDLVACEDLARRSLAAYRDVGEEISETGRLEDLGACNGLMGRTREALRYKEEAMRRHRAAGRKTKEAVSLIGLGRYSVQLGEFQRGIDYLNDALRVLVPLGERFYEALARLNLGQAYLTVGDFEAAAPESRRAREGFTEERRLRALAIDDLGFGRMRMGHPAEARALFEEALELLRPLANRVYVGAVKFDLGTLEMGDGNLDRALARSEEALEDFRAGPALVAEAKAYCQIGEIRRRRGDPAGARTAFEAALAVFPAGEYLGAVAGAESGLARLSKDAGDLAGARHHAERAVKAVDSIRAAVASQQARGFALASAQSAYDLLIDVLIRQDEAEPGTGHAGEALEVSERSRARGLLEILGEGGVDIREGVDPALVAEERSLREALDFKAAELTKRREKKRPTVPLETEIESLRTSLAEAQGRIRRSSPRYAALTQPQPLPAEAIQREVLADGTLLLEYHLGENASALWVVSAKSIATYRLAPRERVETTARRVLDLLATPAVSSGGGTEGKRAFRTAAAALSDLVLGPAASVLGDKRLLIVAEGVLQYVPFAALPLPERTGASAGLYAPLVSRHEVVSAPSASVVATLRRETAGRARASKEVVVLADPVFEASDPRVAASSDRVRDRTPSPAPPDPPVRGAWGAWDRGSFSRLPFSRLEADTIVSLAPRGSSREATDFEASKETATGGALGEFRFVHFATHGLLDTRHPELSGLVLSLVDRTGRARDGYLRLQDIYNLRLGADLVVLSGCRTGLGQDVRGEGLVGLTRGFMYAGAPRVAASLWRVDDRATSELMTRFYRGLLKEGKPPAAALRAAQLELLGIRRWKAPYFWAPFVLHGEWR